ncbi:MAG: hypothetical protein A3B27_01795 [Candidatus Taylorbacteria bacterium RIFCSPLOWO2_01_FULL_50_130]|nr:MAG: hypothetical protein A3B27_01795 [Candidatus Taylorbacteria bacterium RIFCSPLOWO2_01_FULL_50_130]
MNILIVTQKVDVTDNNLGFFHSWLAAFAEHADVVVIANEVGAHELPGNVKVLSLGKEAGKSRIQRLMRYWKLLREHFPSANGVFFHMCPEYVIAAHFLLKKFGKKSAFWYVHRAVSMRLRLAEKLVDKIFTASPESFRLPSKKVEVAGHGIDVKLFPARKERGPGLHVVTVGRISRVKDLRTLILGFLLLKKRFPDAQFSIIGQPITEADRRYERELRDEFESSVSFLGGVSYARVLSGFPYAAFVHASMTGAVDKAVLEALATGSAVFTSSEAFPESIPGIFKFEQGNAGDLADAVARAFEAGKLGYNEGARVYVTGHHNLHTLVSKILSFYEC